MQPVPEGSTGQRGRKAIEHLLKDTLDTLAEKDGGLVIRVQATICLYKVADN